MAARAPRPEDLYDLRVPTDVALSPDGRMWSRSASRRVAPGKDGYRTSLWVAPADGAAPARQLTAGARNDTLAALVARWADARLPLRPRRRPPGRWRRREARQGRRRRRRAAPRSGSSRSPMAARRGSSPTCRRTSRASPGRPTVGGWWSSAAPRSTEPEKKPDRKPDDPPAPDTRLIDTLLYQFNGAGFVHDRFTPPVARRRRDRRGRAPDAGRPPRRRIRAGRPTAGRSRSSRTGTRTRTSAGGATSTS